MRQLDACRHELSKSIKVKLVKMCLTIANYLVTFESLAGADSGASFFQWFQVVDNKQSLSPAYTYRTGYFSNRPTLQQVRYSASLIV